MLKDVLVFSDLDGTLLDHHTYSFAPAWPMLQKLQSHNIPVILNTSKTYAELRELRQQLHLNGPFIVENGAAVYVPVDYFSAQPKDTLCKNGFWIKEFSKPRAHWLSLIEGLKSGFSGEFNHFATMSTAEIIEATGLSLEQAKLAATREYGEPVLWLGSDNRKTEYIRQLESLGVKPLQGGRFLHLSGECDKGKAMLWLTREFEVAHYIHKYKSIALGDGQNDVAMLNAAEIAVRILSPANPVPALSKQSEVHTSQSYGPSGWTECLEQIIFNDTQSN